MFFNTLVLASRGPLGKVWLAAHYRKKLSKKDIVNTNVCQSVEAILHSRIILSLRTSSHLLAGVIYLHNKQADYLLRDALHYAYIVPRETKSIDMAELAAGSEINLTANEIALDFNIFPPTIDVNEYKYANVGRTRLQGDITDIPDEEFSSLGSNRSKSGSVNGGQSIHTEDIIFEDRVYTDDGFGGHLGQDPTQIFDIHPQQVNGDGGLQRNDSEQHPGPSNVQGDGQINQEDGPQIFIDDFDDQQHQYNHNDQQQAAQEIGGESESEANQRETLRPQVETGKVSIEAGRKMSSVRFSRLGAEESDIILEPIGSLDRQPKRARVISKVTIDRVTGIPNQKMMEHMRKTDDLKSDPILAPVSKYQMKLKETGSCSALLNRPAISSISSKLAKRFERLLNNIRQNDLPEDLLDSQALGEGGQPDLRDHHQDENPFSPQDDILPPMEENEPMQEDNQQQAQEGENRQLPPEELELPKEMPPPRSQEHVSQRKRKRPRLSQEQVRRGTFGDLDFINMELHQEFDQSELGSSSARGPFSPSESQSFTTSSVDDTLLSQLSQDIEEPVTFAFLTQGYNRKKAAVTFFQLLCLHKKTVVILHQKEAYAEILIQKGADFRCQVPI